MPIQQLDLVDFCNQPLKASKKISLQPPLDAVEPVGLASLGCNPLLSHQETGTGTILSRVNQKTGTDTGSLLTTTDDSNHNTSPFYSAYIAGLRAANPISGSVASPFPASLVNYQYDWTIGGFTAARLSQPLNNLFNFGEFPVGFGGFRANPWIVLGGPETYDAVNLSFLHPYHTYDQQLLIGYCPTDPMTLIYDASVPELVWHNSSPNATSFSFSKEIDNGNGTATVYSVNLTMWECFPALTAFSGTTVSPNILFPTSLEAQLPPGFTRTYGYLSEGQITLPGYGATVAPVSYPVAPVRPWMVVYATALTDSISLNGTNGASFGGSAPLARVPYFAPGNNMWAAPQSFSWNSNLLPNTFTWDIVVGGQHLTPVTKTVGNATIPHFYEALAISQITIVPFP